MHAKITRSVFLYMVLFITILTAFITLQNKQSKSSNYQDTQNNIINLHKTDTPWTILSYWATWCGQCLQEIPILNEIQTEYPQQVAVYGVNFEGLEKGQLRAVEKQLGFKYSNLLRDPLSDLNAGEIVGVPTLLLLNSNKVVKVIQGETTKLALVEAMGLEQVNDQG